MAIPTDFVAHYTMDNISGTTLVDESANSKDGVIAGAVPAPGKINNALEFNGGTSDRVTLSSLFSGWATDFSISLWVDVTIRADTYDSPIIHDPDIGGGNRFRLFDYSGGASDWLGFSVGSTAITSAKPAAGFRHLILTYNRTTGEITYDIDDVSQGTATAASGITFATGDTYIGAVPSGYVGGAKSILGKVDEVRVYDRILTPTEKTSLFNETAQFFGIQGTVSETLTATDFFVRASELVNGTHITDAVVAGDGTYEINLSLVSGYSGYTDEILLTCLPKTGKRRLNSTAYAVGDYYLPADVTTNEHIYKVTAITTGITAATEPVLDQAGGTTVDGGVTVQDMGAAPTPISQINYSETIEI